MPSAPSLPEHRTGGKKPLDELEKAHKFLYRSHPTENAREIRASMRGEASAESVHFDHDLALKVAKMGDARNELGNIVERGRPTSVDSPRGDVHP